MTKDLVGQRFGMLVVESFAEMGQHGKEYWCKCECGNRKRYRGSTLTSGTIQACGCKRGTTNRGLRRPEQARSHIGEQHGFLKIVGVDEMKRSRRRDWLVLCQCDCGNSTSQIYADIKRGRVKSCGCWNREQASINGTKVCLANGTTRCGQRKWVHNRPDGKSVRMRSGFEIMVAEWLDRTGIKWEYEPKCFVLEKGMRYTPDFFLVDENRWIEVKGRLTDNAVRKMTKFQQQGHRLTMMQQSDCENAYGCCVRTFYRHWDKRKA